MHGTNEKKQSVGNHARRHWKGGLCAEGRSPLQLHRVDTWRCARAPARVSRGCIASSLASMPQTLRARTRTAAAPLTHRYLLLRKYSARLSRMVSMASWPMGSSGKEEVRVLVAVEGRARQG